MQRDSPRAENGHVSDRKIDRWIDRYSKVGYRIRPSVAFGVPETHLDIIDPQTIVTLVVSSKNLFEIARSRLGNDSFIKKKTVVGSAQVQRKKPDDRIRPIGWRLGDQWSRTPDSIIQSTR